MKKLENGTTFRMIAMAGFLSIGTTGCLLQPTGRGNLDPNRSIVHTTPPQSPWINPDGVSSSAQDLSSDFDGDSVPDGPLAPVTELDVVGTGYRRGVTFTARANRRLKVRFTPDLQQSPTTAGGLIPEYSKLGVYITVNGRSNPTRLLHNGMASSQEKSRIMDFSFATDCSGDELCSVRIKIEKPNYDFYCLMYPYGIWDSTRGRWNYPCPSVGYSRVHETHRWYGKFEIETDTTENIEE